MTPYLHPDNVIARLRDDLASVAGIVSRWDEDTQPVRRTMRGQLENARIGDEATEIDDRLASGLVMARDGLDEAHKGLTKALAVMEEAHRRIARAKREREDRGLPKFRLDA